MTYGFDPGLSEWSPYHGAAYAVLESLARIAALGGSPQKARLTFQEYFRRMEQPEDWGLPLSALLGAFQTQLACRIPAIGGKDSMSGTFRDLHVPPTLVSFAVQVSDASRVLSSAIDQAEQTIYCLPVPLQSDAPQLFLPDCQRFMDQLQVIDQLSSQHRPAGCFRGAPQRHRRGCCENVSGQPAWLFLYSRFAGNLVQAPAWRVAACTGFRPDSADAH